MADPEGFDDDPTRPWRPSWDPDVDGDHIGHAVRRIEETLRDTVVPALNRIRAAQEIIMSTQADEDAAVAQVQVDVDALTAAVPQIQSGIDALHAEIANLQNTPGVDVSGLQAVAARLDTATQSVAAIVANPAPAPAPGPGPAPAPAPAQDPAANPPAEFTGPDSTDAQAQTT